MDVDAHHDDARHPLGTTFRLYRVTLEQFNDVLAQENGMLPGDPACVAITAEEARKFARAWTIGHEQSAGAGAVKGPESELSVHGGVLDAFKGPPAEMRAPSKRWYGYVKCIGVHQGEAVLTFTCPPEELAAFRRGDVDTNEPSEAYLGTIERGLVQMGMTTDLAREYLRQRCDAPVGVEGARQAR